MTDAQEYNRQQYGRLWAVSCLPGGWPGWAILVAAGGNQAAIDWAGLTQAVGDFQQAQGLNVDGKLGPDTLARLHEVYAYAFPAPAVDGASARLAMYHVAESQLGVYEYPGGAENPHLLRYWVETKLSQTPDEDEAWCSVFVNWCALKARVQRSGKANARSWLDAGVEATTPELGDIVVFWRDSKDSWKGHVALFHSLSDDGNWINVLGGNQGSRVCVKPYEAGRKLGYRRLAYLA